MSGHIPLQAKQDILATHCNHNGILQVKEK